MRTIKGKWATMAGAVLVLTGMGLVAGAAPPAQDEAFPVPKPTKEHDRLRKEAGSWDATVKSWMAPNTEPMVSKGTETGRMLAGGLWLVQDFRGEFGGREFRGHGQMGYDTNKKKYVGTWIDSFSTSILVLEGEYDEAKQETVFVGEMPDPATGQMIKFRNVGKLIGNDTRVFAMYVPGPDGKEFKTMEIEYKRRAEPDQAK